MIEKIEIKYFRSIYHISLNKIDRINVITGKNDVGKSNILRALNLFFNNCISKPNDYYFSKNFNYKRLEEVRKETVKGRQFIQIKVTFNRGDQFEKTLPKRFTITKKWVRDSDDPEVSDNVEAMLKKEGRATTKRTQQSLKRFLNRISYVYVSAIKDSELFSDMLHQLQDTVHSKALSKEQSLIDTMHEISDTVARTTEELSKEFLQATNISSRVSTPRSIDRLYNTLHVDTTTHNGDIPIEDRGDGIQARYIPAILNYISKNTTDKYIWGFEEPENSLEFNMAMEMAGDFYNNYSKSNTIILTTHSPAFIDLATKHNGRGYRCYIEDDATNAVAFQDEDDKKVLSEELGYARILMEQYEDYKMRKEENEKLKNSVNELSEQMKTMTKPVVLTEGKTDASILEIAWKKLYDKEMPFVIKSCSVTDENEGQSSGGANMLRKVMTAVRYDASNITIGVFDNDVEGQHGFELDNHYIRTPGEEWKTHNNGKGYALLLPADADTKIIADRGKLTIEKMFDYDDIKKEVNGKRLRLKSVKRMVKIGNVDIAEEEAGEEFWYMCDIEKHSKKDFAKDIVPSFGKYNFRRFEPLFKCIIKIIECGTC